MKRNPYYDPDEDGQPANAIRTMEGHKSEVRIHEETALCINSRVGFRLRFQPSETVYASFGVRAVQTVPVYFTKFRLYRCLDPKMLLLICGMFPSLSMTRVQVYHAAPSSLRREDKVTSHPCTGIKMGHTLLLAAMTLSFAY